MTLRKKGGLTFWNFCTNHLLHFVAEGKREGSKFKTFQHQETQDFNVMLARSHRQLPLLDWARLAYSGCNFPRIFRPATASRRMPTRVASRICFSASTRICFSGCLRLRVPCASCMPGGCEARAIRVPEGHTQDSRHGRVVKVAIFGTAKLVSPRGQVSHASTTDHGFGFGAPWQQRRNES